jgi:DNA-binding NarL/FixJ family response regulator
MAGDTGNNMTNLDTTAGAARFRALTDREQQVAMLVCGGLANKVIARELAVTEGTVKQHACNIYRKLHIQNRSQLIITLLNPKN